MIENQILNFKNARKGENGTVLLIGGSELYTGAPYFASIAALRCGCDLIYVYAKNSSIQSLKVLIPEAIVLNLAYDEWILNRVNVCIFGCGLGRPPEEALTIIMKILKYLAHRNVYIIVDGDGLHYIDHLILFSYKNIIFTPNFNEKKYMKDLSEGQYIVQKGKTDHILTEKSVYSVDSDVCQKRCGGQGDILSGVVASFLIKSKDYISKNDPIENKIAEILKLSCVTVRTAARMAYNKYNISLITRDILEFLPEAVQTILNVKTEQ